MNKRIQELADQANVHISYRVCPHTFKEIDDPAGPYVRTEFDKEKFAESIVKECHMLAVGNANWLPKDVSPATGMNDVFEKYFGVKE